MPPSPEAQAPQPLREALIEEAYRQGYGGVPMTGLAIISLDVLHWMNHGESLPLIWLTIAAILTIGRGVILYLHATARLPRSLTKREALFGTPLLLTALLWGTLPFFVFPDASPLEKLGFVCVFSGMAGGGASVLAPLLWPARIYIFCVLVPASILIYDTEGMGPIIFLLGISFFVIMLLAHAQSRRMLVTAQSRLMENQALLSDVRQQQAMVGQLNNDLLTAQQALKERNATLEQEVEERTARNRLAFSVIENTASGVMVMTPETTVIEVNPAFSRITGYGPEDIIGQSARLLGSERTDDALFTEMWLRLKQHYRWDGELWSRRKDGSTFLERRSIDAVRNGQGVVTHYVSVFSDITEDFKKDEQLRQLATHDPLTGLANRALFNERLQHGIAQASRRKSKLGIMFLDLDQFKSVNDSLGHHVGDQLLRGVARRLRACLRNSDTLARQGGDEFVILMAEIKEGRDCGIIASKLMTALADPFEFPESRIHVRASIGIAVYPDDSQDADTLMKNADMALYAAKAAGRNNFSFFDRAMSEQASERLELELALRDAISKDELSLHYQPKVSASNGRIEGYEALLRWLRLGKGYVPPDRFIPVAEDSGLIDQIGSWVIAEACRQLAAWHSQGFGWQHVAVNVSARQLLHDDLIGQIGSALQKHGVPASQMELEVTESVLMTRPDKTIPILQALRASGMTVAVDDFGTGHSSLAYLRRLPVDVMKIDRAFVHEAEVDLTAQAIIQTIVALSKTLNMKVVAEGVETQAQVDMLGKAGCDLLQGYFFARPAPATEIEAGWNTEKITA